LAENISAPGQEVLAPDRALTGNEVRLMNDHSSPQPAPHDPLAVLRGHFSGWEAWRGVSGLLYVRRRMSSPPVVFRGYTAESLAEQIREHEARRQ
jgi:hypothetical protein